MFSHLLASVLQLMLCHFTALQVMFGCMAECLQVW